MIYLTLGDEIAIIAGLTGFIPILIGVIYIKIRYGDL